MKEVLWWLILNTLPHPLYPQKHDANQLLETNQRFKRLGCPLIMGDLRDLFLRLSQSDQIRGYLNKVNDSLDLIKRCFVILVFLAGLTVFLSEWL